MNLTPTTEAALGGVVTVTLTKTNPEADGPDEAQAQVHWQAHVFTAGRGSACHAYSTLRLPNGQTAPGPSQFAMAGTEQLVGIVTTSGGRQVRADTKMRRHLDDLLQGGSMHVMRAGHPPEPRPAKDHRRVLSVQAQSVLACALLPTINGALAAMGLRPNPAGQNGQPR